jgi:hypothetical protein
LPKSIVNLLEEFRELYNIDGNYINNKFIINFILKKKLQMRIKFKSYMMKFYMVMKIKIWRMRILSKRELIENKNYNKNNMNKNMMNIMIWIKIKMIMILIIPKIVQNYKEKYL